MSSSKARGPSAPAYWHALLSELDHPGCPVCHGAHEAARRYVGSLLWEFVNDSGVRDRLRSSHGFCREHAHLALDVAKKTGNALGMALLYEDFLRHVREEAVAAARAEKAGRFRAVARPEPARLAAHASCPACESAGHVAEGYLRLLAQAGDRSEVAAAARRESRWLCVPHLGLGLRLASSREDAERLLDIYLRGEAEARVNLRELIATPPAAGSVPARVATSWRRAVDMLVGSSEAGDER